LLVIVIGSAQFDRGPFESRGLFLQDHTDRTATKQFRFARALLIAEPPGKLGRIQRRFNSLLLLAEAHGVIVRVLTHSQEEKDIVIGMRERVEAESKRGGSVGLFSIETVERIDEVAETIARARTGPLQTAEARIERGGERISEEETILLRRAFFDSPRLQLQRLHGGKMAAGVFRVHAWCPGALPLQRPLPFFVKFAKPAEIEEERQNYRQWVEPYIPFHLRPNLDHRRCVTGSTLSVLVGNLVEDAIPLRDALRRGLASGTLFGLFEVTLKGLRAQPFAGSATKRTTGLHEFVHKCICREKFEDRPHVVPLARELGLQSSLPDLEYAICRAARSVPHWWAPTHGDLHTGNVMVRRGDAIVIDFGRTGFDRGAGPLTADPATLEASLIFGTDNSDHPDFDEWRAFADRAYECLPFIRPPNPEAEPSLFSWLHSAVREIRHVLFGCDCTDIEAAIVLAAYLMRYARLDIDEFRKRGLGELARKKHAYALVVAERVIRKLPALQQNNYSGPC
jgi:hypothetical protein